MRRKRLTPEERTAVLAAYDAGEKVEATAAAYEIAPAHVSRLAKLNGRPARLARGDQTIEAKTLKAIGAGAATASAIAALTGVGIESQRQFLSRLVRRGAIVVRDRMRSAGPTPANVYALPEARP